MSRIDQFAVHALWISEEALLPRRSCLMRIGTKYVLAQFTSLKHKVDVNTLEYIAADTLGESRDRRFHLDRSIGLRMPPPVPALLPPACVAPPTFTATASLVEKVSRVLLDGHRPAILWFTGLSGSGKSTITDIVERELHALGAHAYMLDGDNERHGLNRDLGFTDADRVENIRRIGAVAKLLVGAGTIVPCSFISRFRAERRMIREIVDVNEFVEVYFDTPLKDCIRRDLKGLYARDGGQDPELHRDRLAVRSAGKTRNCRPYERWGSGGGLATDTRCLEGAACYHLIRSQRPCTPSAPLLRLALPEVHQPIRETRAARVSPNGCCT
jgi:bifunctional enzyme CysN/CysC